MHDYPLNAIDAALTGRRLLDHPFYRRWEAGDLDLRELTAYAEQYRHFEAMLPTFLTTLVERLPDGPARAAVADNLADEVGEPTHLSLFEDFAAHYGAATVEASPAMSDLLAAYDQVLSASDALAIAGLLAYETQGGDVAATKAVGLADHYEASDAALAFWQVHSVAELDHAHWTLDALASLGGDDAVIERAASVVAAAWWRFLDERETLARELVTTSL
jgi:pyrroloquinoline-quinone synthase